MRAADDRSAALADNVGNDRVELDVGRLQRLLQPLNMAGLLMDKLLACAQQLSQLLHFLFGHKTAADQPVGQQVGDPGCIADIGLAARYILDVSGVRQNEFESPIAENIPDGLPVNPSRLHGHMAATLLAEPRQQTQQPGRGRLEGFDFPSNPIALSQAHACHYSVLVNVETGATRVNDFRQSSLHARRQHRDLMDEFSYTGSGGIRAPWHNKG